jgi:hypothetical protein
MSMQISVGDDRDDERDDLDAVVDDDLDSDTDRPERGRRADRGSEQGDGSDDSGEDDEEPEGGWQAEAKRLRAALAKSNATGLRRRNQLRELRNAESKASDEDDTDDDEDGEKPEQKRTTGLDARTLQRQIEKAKKQGRKEAEAEYKRDLLFTKAESRLERAGVSERNVRLLKAEIDLEDFAEEPDEEIDRLKSEFPDLFRSAKSARRRINGGDDRTTERKKGPQTASQRQAAQLRGGA